MMRKGSFGQYALLASMLLLLSVTLLYPIILTVWGGFTASDGEGFTLKYVALVFRDPTMRSGLINALAVAMATTLLSTLIAFPLGMLSAKYEYRYKKLWDAAILVPLILPPFVGAVGMKAILGREGAFNVLFGTDWDILGTNRFWGVVIALALHLYPIMYLNLTASLANLDPSLDEAAGIAGAGPFRRFFKITLPLVRPGIFAGGSIVLIWSFTELGTPLVFDYSEITSVQIFHGIKEMDASAQPYALTVVMLFFAISMYIVGKFTLGREGPSASSRAFRAAETKTLGRRGTLLAALMFGSVTALALVPHAGVVFMSFSQQESWYSTILPAAWTIDNYSAALEHPLVFGSISNSLMLALAAAGIDVVIGIAIGYLIVRTKIRGRTLLDSLAMLPLAVPGLVMAFGFVAASLRWPFGKGAPLEGVIDIVGTNPNPFPLLIIAYAVRRLPYIVRATVAGLSAVGVDLEEAASIFGATTLGRIRRVVIPLITANLMAGALLVFAFSMLEVSDSLILAQQEKHYPITKSIYILTERLGDGTVIASALGVWSMALLAAALTAVSVLLGKSFGSIFRV